MYGSVAGASIVGLPVALAFTGLSGVGVAVLVASAWLLVALGVVLLRLSRNALFR